jgi:glycosyltransferase involved in cell wall biosynthesis
MAYQILVNALGVVDSGGLKVLEKLLAELLSNKSNHYFIVCNDNKSIRQLKKKYQDFAQFNFKIFPKKGILFRLYYENIVFRELVSRHNISLIYNFSGSVQFFLKAPQVTKVQNLLFYSKKLDYAYRQHAQPFPWIRQIFLKRLVFRFMLNRSKHIEIQSSHVKQYLSDFIHTRNKTFYVKSDIDVSDIAFHAPRQYNFSKKIKFLYIVGPHFESLHKKLQDFTNAMMDLIESSVDFEINITLTNEQLNNSKVWDASLNSKTNFLGYISDQEQMKELFCDNTILISTSIIETLGLHVIEGIKGGVITIAPDEEYANTVYGENMFKYGLFNKNALFDTIMTVINCKESYSNRILSIQNDLRQREMSKFESILDVFDTVINVQE